MSGESWIGLWSCNGLKVVKPNQFTKTKINSSKQNKNPQNKIQFTETQKISQNKNHFLTTETVRKCHEYHRVCIFHSNMVLLGVLVTYCGVYFSAEMSDV